MLSLTWAMSSCVQPDSKIFLDPTAKSRLSKIAGWKEEVGSVYYQARIYDYFDYRTTLNKAIQGEPEALGSMFQYTSTGTLFGEGAITHAEVLGELLKLWGDEPYSRILGMQTESVRRKVVSSLDEFWGYPGWPAGRFPLTRALTPGTRRNASYG